MKIFKMENLFYKLEVARSDTLTGYLSKRSKNICSQKICKRVFSVALFIMALEATQMSISRRMDKLWYLHTVEYYSAVTNKILMYETARITLENMLSERSQTKGKRYCKIPFI